MDAVYVCFSMILAGSQVVSGWSANGEMSVRQDFIETDTYHYLVRPNDTVHVKAGLNILTINGLDNAAQQFSVTGWLTVEWEDERLVWTPGNKYDTDHVYSTFGEIWIPELFVDNSVEDVSVLYDENLFLRVSHTGRVGLDYPRIFHTTCNVDVTSFPFDTQICVLELTSWAYTIQELDLEHLLPEVNARLLSPNGEWSYIGSSINRDVIIEETSSGQSQYAMLRYAMKLERMRSFYVTNIILPVTLTAILNVLVFMIPNDSGEKIGYALTILLALAVLLTMIADSMPHTSLHVSVLSFYLALTLCVSVFCVACSVVILRLYLKDPNDERPAWAKLIWKHVGFLVRPTVYPNENEVQHFNANGEGEMKPLSADTTAVQLDNVAEMIPTWADVANALDWVAFFVNTAIIVFVTILVMIILCL
ncbi:neuronal acetylcholine receptor subunit beta-4-like [Pecten maximus]|uniref:neuronal acetylcholine receptor subunit beta-4-like n=1 Tax=Pecten maximus TaxID=6579 RepID=UPI001458AE7F|nr:neuronal acetylcholine receptor subunit beta-4-like [Pecten maximus]